MPIRPENMHHYGKAWRALRAIVLVRAGHTCECTGECGIGNRHVEVDVETGENIQEGRCAAPNGIDIARIDDDDLKFMWLRWGEHDEAAWPWKKVRVVLTVAHLNQTAGDDRLENLKAMCQLCHLRLDRHQHAATAARTRRAKQGAELPLENV